MVATPDFEAMTIEELAEYKLARKAEADRIYDEEIRPANVIQDRKIVEAHVAEAHKQIDLRAAIEGISSDELALRWLGETVRGDSPADPALGHNVQARLYFGLPRLGREPEGWNLGAVIVEISRRIAGGN